ncbi:uncharacterized protein LOC144629687 [Oculina patagonica]
MGFGRHGFEFWLGNDFVYGVTYFGEHLLRIEKSSTVDGHSQTSFSEYVNFRVSSPFSNYILHVGQYQGNLSDILSDANNSAFSTWDRDNDKVNGSCARRNKGAWWYGSTCNIQDLNSMLGNVTAQGLVKITMKTKEVFRGHCKSLSAVLGRVECGWPGITKEQCLARDCCYDNNTADNVTKCFVKLHFVFPERIGCFSIEKEQINSLENRDPRLETQRPRPIQDCSSEAWSRGLKVFAVYNGSECLGDYNLSSILPRLNASEGCLGGRGGQNVTDVYRFTIFVTKLTGLRASYLTFESVRVDWNLVPELFVLGYKVQVQNTSFSLFVAWNISSAHVNGLHSNTAYVIEVFPVHGLTAEGNSYRKFAKHHCYYQTSSSSISSS